MRINVQDALGQNLEQGDFIIFLGSNKLLYYGKILRFTHKTAVVHSITTLPIKSCTKDYLIKSRKHLIRLNSLRRIVIKISNKEKMDELYYSSYPENNHFKFSKIS